MLPVKGLLKIILQVCVHDGVFLCHTVFEYLIVSLIRPDYLLYRVKSYATNKLQLSHVRFSTINLYSHVAYCVFRYYSNEISHITKTDKLTNFKLVQRKGIIVPITLINSLCYKNFLLKTPFCTQHKIKSM